MQAVTNVPLGLGPTLSRPVLRNVSGLYLDVLTSYLFPLITLPYLVRVLGPRTYGALAFSQSLIAYFLVVVDYGLLISGAREAVRLKDDPSSLGLFASTVVIFRMLVAGILLPLIMLVVFHSLPDKTERFAAIILSLGVIFAAISCNWLYLALGRMSSLATINFFVNLVVLAAIFLFVNQPKDLVVLAVILAAGPAIGNTASLGLAQHHLALRWHRPKPSDVIQFGKKGFPIFLSQASVALYTSANPFLLGLWSSRESVAFFAAGEKIVRALLRMVSPLWMALFPTMVERARKSPQELLSNATKVFFAFILITSVFTCALLAGAPSLVNLLFGERFVPAISSLRILSLLLVLVPASSILTLHILVPLGHDKTFTTITVLAGLTNVVLAAVLTPHWHHLGMAWAAVLSEALVLVVAFVIVAVAQRNKNQCNPQAKGVLNNAS